MLDINKIFSESEKEMMNEWVRAYGAGPRSYSESRIPFEDVLEQSWAKNKEALYHVFGDQLILSKQVEFSVPADMLADQIRDMIYCSVGAGAKFYNALSAKMEVHWSNPDYNIWRHVAELCNPYTLSDNYYSGLDFEIYDPKAGKNIKIPHGCKPVKMLGKIAEAYDLEGFEEFRLEHSRIFNQAKLTGELCLSIHPMDYMTMSDNDNDWSSCMSWRENGCYRRGTIEMMNSPIVVVAYLKSKENMHIHSWNKTWEWNNKKWRSLIVVDEDFITSIKGYPYQSEDLASASVEWLSKLYTDTYTESKAQELLYCSCSFQNKDAQGKEFMVYPVEFSTTDMYNDFGTARHYVIFNKKGNFAQMPRKYLNYSGDTQCVWCGSIHERFGTEEQLVCLSCGGEEEAEYYCPCCDSELNSEYDIIDVDGYGYCEFCINDHCTKDAITGDWIRLDEAISIYLTDENGINPKIPDYHYITCDLHRDISEETRTAFGFPEFQTNSDGEYYVNYKNCTKAQLKNFFHLNTETELNDYLYDIIKN